jgi:hypothetical protein
VSCWKTASRYRDHAIKHGGFALIGIGWQLFFNWQWRRLSHAFIHRATLAGIPDIPGGTPFNQSGRAGDIGWTAVVSSGFESSVGGKTNN